MSKLQMEVVLDRALRAEAKLDARVMALQALQRRMEEHYPPGTLMAEVSRRWAAELAKLADPR